jgi:hypothetical protein
MRILIHAYYKEDTPTLYKLGILLRSKIDFFRRGNQKNTGICSYKEMMWITVLLA